MIRLLGENATAEEIEALPAPTGIEYIPFLHEESWVGRKVEMTAWMMRTETVFGTVTRKRPHGPKRGLPKFKFDGVFKYNNLKMPTWIYAQAHAFFKWTLEEKHTEAVVLLCMNDDDEWRVFVPSQMNSYASVDYRFDPEADLPAGWCVVGSIHSHCDFSAFHSGTDTHDAGKNDGLHITLGHVDREIAESDVMFSFSGLRWNNWKIEDVLDGPVPTASDDFPGDWKNTLMEMPRRVEPVKVPRDEGYGKFLPSLFDADDDFLEEYYSKMHEEWKKKDEEEARPTGRMDVTLSAKSYTYGTRERAMNMLRHDMRRFADFLAMWNIELEYRINAGQSVDDPAPSEAKGRRKRKG